MGIWFMTGFEGQTTQIIPASDQWGMGISTSTKKSGNCSCYLQTPNQGSGGFHVRVPSSMTITNIYGAHWFHPHDASGTDSSCRLFIYYTDNSYNQIWWYRYGRMYYYRGDTQVVETAVLMASDWNHIQWWVYADSTNGRVVVYWNGIEVINYTGNTRPGNSSQVSYVSFQFHKQWYSGQSLVTYLDDLVLSDSGFPGDIRVERIYPNADTANKAWTPQSGSDNYAMVDEVPRARITCTPAPTEQWTTMRSAPST